MELKIDIQSDVPDRNGRICSKNVLKKAIDDYQEKIEQKKSIGFLGYGDVDINNLKNASHLVTSLKTDENGNILADIEFLSTDAGKIAKNIIKNNMSNFSMRVIGFGDIIDNKVENANITSINCILNNLDENQPETITLTNEPPRSSEKLKVKLDLNSPLPIPMSKTKLSESLNNLIEIGEDCKRCGWKDEEVIYCSSTHKITVGMLLALKEII
jgi:hypothetical protein